MRLSEPGIFFRRHTRFRTYRSCPGYFYSFNTSGMGDHIEPDLVGSMDGVCDALPKKTPSGWMQLKGAIRMHNS